MEKALLNLESKKVVRSTVDLITNYLYENRNVLSNDLLLFYNDVRSIIQNEVRKASTQRLHMNDVLERAYNIESYILAAGAASYEVEFVNL